MRISLTFSITHRDTICLYKPLPTAPRRYSTAGLVVAIGRSVLATTHGTVAAGWIA